MQIEINLPEQYSELNHKTEYISQIFNKIIYEIEKKNVVDSEFLKDLKFIINDYVHQYNNFFVEESFGQGDEDELY